MVSPCILSFLQEVFAKDWRLAASAHACSRAREYPEKIALVLSSEMIWADPNKSPPPVLKFSPSQRGRGVSGCIYTHPSFWGQLTSNGVEGEGDSIPSPVLSSSLPPLTLVDTCAKYLVRVSCTRLTGAHAAHVHTPRLALVWSLHASSVPEIAQIWQKFHF